uniref:NADH-ubiquinone oxidoreductase chain 4L n=1 Tax=Epanerchodus koreanus TaxID=2678661 RepID=A0A7L8I023_9MYRI|nr:NADH dehydrogenase subunit 4L [Epanerchodus koreanus]QOE55896.1 NADH dehydrogenase subunit 4L [Epanerchodus koreanus]
MMIFGGIFIITGFISMVFSYKHVLNMLLSLEFLMVGLMMLFFFWVNLGSSELVFIFYYIVFMVGEGVLGLGMLVSLVRWNGSDFFLSFSSINY